MKKYTFLFVLACSAMTLMAQESMEVSKSMVVTLDEAVQAMSAGTNNALVLSIPGTTAKQSESTWKSFIKKYKGKTKRDRKSGEYFTDDAKLENVSDNAVDVYATFDDGGSGAVTTVWFNLGGGYLSSEQHPDRYTAAVELLKRYASMVGKAEAEDELKEQEKVLKSYVKDLDRLKKDNEGFHNKIEDAKKLISEMEQNIKKNEKEQEDKNSSIEQQTEEVKKADEKVKEFVF